MASTRRNKVTGPFPALTGENQNLKGTNRWKNQQFGTQRAQVPPQNSLAHSFPSHKTSKSNIQQSQIRPPPRKTALSNNGKTFVAPNHDKENCGNKTRPPPNNQSKRTTKSNFAIGNANKTTSPNTATIRASSQSIAFTPGTKITGSSAKSTGLNSLRRSLRESITPPNQKKHTEKMSPPYGLLAPSVANGETFLPRISHPATNPIPKTPKSILKEQLEMSIDETMLLSPGADSFLHNSIALSSDMKSPAGKQEQKGLGRGASKPPQEEKNAQLSKESREERQSVQTQELPRKTSEPAPEMGSTKVSVFSASRNMMRSKIKKSRLKSNRASSHPSIGAVSEKPAGKETSETDYETPYVIQDVKFHDAISTGPATPHNQREDGVCMDLTAMFSNEQKTTRKSNKSTLPLKDPKASVQMRSSVSHEAKHVTVALSCEEEWAEIQCSTFTEWLNFTLDPSEDLQDKASTRQHLQDGSCKMSPSAMRDLILHQRLAKARTAALKLYKGEDMQKIRYAIHSEIARGKLAIRADRDIFADLTLRKKIISLLFSYSTPWLRLGVETLFDETILPGLPSQSSPLRRSDCQSRGSSSQQLRTSLKDFIINRLLSDAAVLAKYTKGRCKVPSGNFEKRYLAEMRTLVLSRLLELFFFLDRAKGAEILEKTPRLFAKNALVKSSREVLLSFCRDFLASEGDITKHLSRVGLKANYKQDPLDEIEFRITNFALDLRDGIRLTKIAEILTGCQPKSLLSKLRIPAVSRLQKLHNVNIALEAIREKIFYSKDISAHYVVDGHRSMVLRLIWSIIASYCFPAVLDFEEVEKETSLLERKLQERQRKAELPFASMGSISSLRVQDKGTLLLLQWCQAVCALFDFEVADFSESFADGRALCLLVHYYHPTLLSLDEIQPISKDQNMRGSSNLSLAHNRMSILGGIPNMIPTSISTMAPDDKSMIVYLCYAFSRLISSRNEVQACLTVQARYRKHRSRLQLAKETRAGLTICRYWMDYRENFFRNQRLQFSDAIAKIEAFVDSRRETLKCMKLERMKKERIHDAVVLIQKQVRRLLAKIRFTVLSKQVAAAACIQHCFRSKEAARTYNELRAALKLQSLLRGIHTRKVLSVSVSSAILVQAFVRGGVVRRQFNAMYEASVCLQKNWRAFWGQLQFQVDLLDIVAVQNMVRRRQAIKLRRQMACSILVLQTTMRRYIALCRHCRRCREAEVCRELYTHATAIQRVVRGFLASRKAARKQITTQAASCIQQTWRASIARMQISRYSLATTKIQNFYRAYFRQRQFMAVCSSAKTIQATWRHHRINTCRKFALKLQAFARQCSCRKQVRSRRDAVTVLQNAARCYHAKHSFALLRIERSILIATVVFCQAHIRRYLAMRALANSLKLATCIQSFFRGYTVRLKLVRMDGSAALIQAYCRKYIYRAKFLDMANAGIITLQALVRSRLEKSKYEFVIRKIKQIQALSRGYHKRGQMLQARMSSTIVIGNAVKLRSMYSQAARKLQTWWRCQSKKYHDKYQREKAAIVIQSIYRRDAAVRTLNDAVRASTVIQCSLRCYQLSQYYKRVRMNTVKVQVLFRGYISRREIHERIQLESLTKTLLIQSTQVRDSVSHASITIQCRWHFYRKKRAVKLMHDAVPLLQAFFRGKGPRRMFQESLSCVVVLQSVFRGFCARRDLRLMRYHAAVIQGAWRGFIAVVRFRMLLIDVLVGQTYARRWLAKRRANQSRSAVLRIQCVGRTWLCRREKAELAKQKQETGNMETFALVVQRFCRGYKARQCYKRECAARDIQKCWRCYNVHVDFLISLLSAMAIQSQARRFVARNQYFGKRSAIVLIQAVCRKLQARELFLKKRSQIVLLQAKSRAFLACAFIAKRTEAAIGLQRKWRRVRTRNREILKQFMAIEIQRIWRGFVDNFRFNLLIYATLQAQRTFRGLLAKKRRAKLERKRKLLKKPLAAITIQSFAREFIARASFRRLQHQVVCMQALIRGHRVRSRRPRRMEVTAARLKEASLKATKSPNMQLGARTLAALFTLQTSNRLAQIMAALCTLEVSTRYSPACCEAFAHARAADILLSLTRQCNRSLPCIELMSIILLVLKNVARYDCFLTYVSTVNCAKILLDILQMYRDKKSIFCTTVHLLERCITYDEDVLGLCQVHENKRRLESLATLISRRKGAVNGSNPSSSKALRSTTAVSHRTPSSTLKQRDDSFDEGLRVLHRVISHIRK